jgi:hypothetical protein
MNNFSQPNNYVSRCNTYFGTVPCAPNAPNAQNTPNTGHKTLPVHFENSTLKPENNFNTKSTHFADFPGVFTNYEVTDKYKKKALTPEEFCLRENGLFPYNRDVPNSPPKNKYTFTDEKETKNKKRSHKKTKKCSKEAMYKLARELFKSMIMEMIEEKLDSMMEEFVEKFFQTMKEFLNQTFNLKTTSKPQEHTSFNFNQLDKKEPDNGVVSGYNIRPTSEPMDLKNFGEPLIQHNEVKTMEQMMNDNHFTVQNETNKDTLNKFVEEHDQQSNATDLKNFFYADMMLELKNKMTNEIIEQMYKKTKEDSDTELELSSDESE